MTANIACFRDLTKLLFAVHLSHFATDFLLNMRCLINTMKEDMFDSHQEGLLQNYSCLSLWILQLTNRLFHISFFSHWISLISANLLIRFLLLSRYCLFQYKFLPKACRDSDSNQWQFQIVSFLLISKNHLFLPLNTAICCPFPFLALTSARKQWYLLDFFRF